MRKKQLQPQKALSPAYRKFNPVQADVDRFVTELAACIDTIKLVDAKNESEEHLKSPIRKFFSSTFYCDNEINTRERIDLAVYLGKDASSDIGILIEAKKPSNKAEFPTVNKLNSKALQEVLLYYLRERIDHKNNNIKHLVITNGFEWFFFKAEDFYNLFYKNRSLVKEYGQFRDGLKDTSLNELFYKEIAQKYIAEVEDELPFVYLNFRNEDLATLKPKQLDAIYKLFSDVHLLGKNFGNDSNQLNKAFYNELLHIIGLEETKEAGKKLIQRKKESARDYGSLLENTIFTLEDKDFLVKVKSIANDEKKAFTVGLELCLTWVNRILFLKLLESQLLTYNENAPEYKFLNFDFLNGFDELNELFFSALAKPMQERHARYAQKFRHIPYLNSSLFERNDLEDLTFDITALMDEKMEVYSSTVLKDSNGKKLTGRLNTLDYLFRFLDSYDFSTESGVKTEERHEHKTLINASVLGLIFEKINGYKDGSFYTPGAITMFMCDEALKRSVTQKFKEEVQDIETFDDVRDYCQRFFKKEDIKRLNAIIDSIRICDPAVGSGHFLVSALNEMIAIKSELRILADEDYAVLPCDVQIENDELYISDATGEPFAYHRRDPHSLRIQKAVFHAKENLIENCLFGVDLNPNSVNICRLRLWIELLKNAYYTAEGELQTLPNIDINIKCGNSLISRYALSDSLDAAFKNKDVNYSIEDYKQAVKEYKTTNSKSKKREVEGIIHTIKNNFKSTYDNKLKDKVSKAVGELSNEEQRHQNLLNFGQSIKKSEKDHLKKLRQKAEAARKEKEERINNVMYRNAFEWRFEFPEVLDNDGKYIGFDVVIGNPPYIQLQKLGNDGANLQKMNYETYAKTGDIYSLFYEQGNNILKQNGLLMFITSNKWMRAAYGESLRRYFVEQTNPLLLIDFAGNQIFDTATVDTNILLFAKQKNEFQTEACVVKEKLLNNLSVFVRQHSQICHFNNSDSWVVLSPIEQSIKRKIESVGTPLKDWDINIYRGILTGYNEAFIIDGKKKDELIAEDPKSAEIIRPILRGRDIKRYGYNFDDKYIICARLATKIPENYPAVSRYLKNFKGPGKLGDNSTTKVFRRPWWSWMQEPVNYWDDFDKQKIMYPNMTKFMPFYLDENNFLQNDKSFMITGEKLYFLAAFLNSSLFKYCFTESFPELQGGTRELRKVFLDKIPVLPVTLEQNLLFRPLVLKCQQLAAANADVSEAVRAIDTLIFNMYDLSEEERAIVGSIEFQ